MIKLIILQLFFIKALTQDDQTSQDNNETVGLLLPNLHLTALRAKARHDINLARLRHHLPLRRHNLLLEITPEFLKENETIGEISLDSFENLGRNSNKILNTTENIIKGIVNQDSEGSEGIITSRSQLDPEEEEEENSKEITELLKKVFYYILERQKSNTSNASLEESQKVIKNNSSISKEGMEFWKIMQENVKPFIKINQNNFTANGSEIPQFELDQTPIEADLRIFDYLQKMFSSIVKEELSKRKEPLNRKRRNNKPINQNSTNNEYKEEFKKRLDDLMLTMVYKIEEYMSNETIISKLIDADPTFNEEPQKKLEPFLVGVSLSQKIDSPNAENPTEHNQKEEILGKKLTKHQRRKNDEKPFLESLNYFKGNDDVGYEHFKRSIEEQPTDLLRHGKALHTHHFSLTHGVEHHPPPSNHFFTKPHPILVLHDHPKLITPPHVTINEQQNFLPPHGHVSIDQHNFNHRDSNLRNSFIIQAPPNTFDHPTVFKRSVPLLRLIADPNVKLDMPKTIENIGTVTKNSFEDDKAPMYHIRNMVGSAKNVILAALRIPPQDVMIPTQYKIMDRSDLKKNRSPEIVSRFADISDEDRFIQTFKRIGLMLRESIKSGQETLQHMTDVAHSARKAIVTTGYATPKFLTPYVKATAIKKDKIPEKLMLITPRIGEVTDRESSPDPTDEYLKMGDLMDAFGVSNPEKKKVGLTRFVMHPKKSSGIQSRFGDDQKKKKDFFLVAEHIDDGKEDVVKSKNRLKDVIEGKPLKDILINIREEIAKKSKDKNENNLNLKTDKTREFFEKLFPVKNDDYLNEIPEDFDKDIEEILNFDWEKIEAIPGGERSKEVDTNKLKPNQNIDYNELYQNVVQERNEDMKKLKENVE